MTNSELDESRLRRLIDAGADVVSNLDTDSLLAQIVETAAETTGARYAALGILNSDRDGLDRFITFGIDDETRMRIGDPPSGLGVLGVLIKHPEPIRLHRVSEHPESFGFPPNHPPMESFLGAPIIIGDDVYGNLYLTDKHDADFDQADQDAVELLAGWAAIAINNARSVRKERLRAVIEASENERHRWALELHDETLQGLGALRLLLSAAQRSEDPSRMRSAIGDALDQLSLEITGLRGLITELRPAALDSLGLEAALESLGRRAAGTGDFDLELDIDFGQHGVSAEASELETTAYRLVQEAISNATKHARASLVVLRVKRDESAIEIELTDNGVGFDPQTLEPTGFGLMGMRERVAIVNGRLDIESRPGAGTRIHAYLPLAD
ncbi:MAG: GAF domain-containing protein [Solirubrobacterales bacterium]